MQLFSFCTIGFMGFFFSIEAAKIYFLFLISDVCFPAPITIFHPRDAAYAFQPIFIVMLAICSILTMRGLAQIFKTVIRLDSVDVVNLFCGHMPGNVEPRQAMGRIRSSIYLNINISLVFFKVASGIANFHLWARQSPFENPRLWVIRQDRSEVRMFHVGILPDFRNDCNGGAA